MNALQAETLAGLRAREVDAHTRTALVVRAARAERKAARAVTSARRATERLVLATR
jgi:hypothetical protein